MAEKVLSNQRDNKQNNANIESFKYDEMLESICYYAELDGHWPSDYEWQPYPAQVIHVADVIETPEYHDIDVFWTHEAPEQLILHPEDDDFYGYIYLATNNINGYQYVGQTINPVLTRWRTHVRDSRHVKCSVFDRAIRKYGENNFTITTIDFACSPVELNNKECYWIAMYDVCMAMGSTHGYNCKLGGQGLSYDLDESYVCELYANGKSMDAIAYILGLERSTAVRSIIQRKGLLRPRTNYTTHFATQRAATIWVAQFDHNRNVINTFLSYTAAARWLIQNNLTDARLLDHVITGIRHACEEQRAGYGYYWCTGITKEDALHSVATFPLPDNKVLTPYIPWSLREANICAYEGCNRIIERRATYCFEHVKIMQRRFDDDMNQIIALVASKGFQATGRHYNVSGNAIKKRLRSAGLPSKKEELIQYAYRHEIFSLPFSDEITDEIIACIESGRSYCWIKDHFHEINPAIYGYLCTKINIDADELNRRQQAYASKFKRQAVEKWTSDNRKLIAVFDTTTDAADSLLDVEDKCTAVHCIGQSCRTGYQYHSYHWKWHTSMGN